MDTNLNQKTESSDQNVGTIPFRFKVPLVKYALENGKKVVRVTVGIYYELVGITRGKGHAKLMKLLKPDGDDNPHNDPDILIDLEMANAREAIEEYEQIALQRSDKLYWSQPNEMSVVR